MARLRALAFACAALAAVQGCQRDAEVTGASVASQGCLACHAADKGRILAPSFDAIAERYATDKNAAALLAESLKSGSHGKWTGYAGAQMPPQSQLSEAERKALVRSVLGR